MSTGRTIETLRRRTYSSGSTCHVAPDRAAVITTTGAGAAWTDSALVTIIAANAVTVDYWVVGLQVEVMAAEDYQVGLATGLATVATSICNIGVSVDIPNQTRQIQLSVPIKVTANTTLCGFSASPSGAAGAGIKVQYATGLE